MDRAPRYAVAMALAAAVTLGLLLLMQTMIATGERDIDESVPLRLADVTMGEAQVEADVNPVRPGKVAEPMPPPLQAAGAADPARRGAVVAAMPPQEFRPDSGTGRAFPDSEYLPLVKVAPAYPREAQDRGTSGYCVVEYTVTAAGATRDAVAVDCSPQGVWEDASVRAALKFKYKPRVVDGQPVEVRGVRNRFLFELGR